ncbi:hypothetical protein DDZ18_01925 [Marinicauda salina]|uniref:YMGG-like Gly-zipper domain-containing protein n=1 Tax=Marinicauda salina TaxID=2135793 RepID=A0A2U2BWJ2_9PROT|nr:YMGG-like glycine zipper-containing protein [Marinicauda salina]PWE18388.1 hypothetical protein DDZ18_01925 [Marinicauda salina]
MRTLLALAVLAPALGLSACAGYENTQRRAAEGALVGAAVGGAAGAVSGDIEPGEGALIGAGVGAAVGAFQGCREDNRCPWSRNNDQHSRLMYDERYGREYYENYRTGCTYWRNGELRSCPR